MGVNATAASPRLLGLACAAAALVIDQAHKLWMLNSYGIEARQPVRLAPFFDLVMAWNPGVSYSLFSARTDQGRWMLLGLTLAATLILGIWMWRTRLTLTAAGLGLIVGGALGNAYDRFAYGAVADFFHFHIGSFSWYVFNLADCAIVAGVLLLLYESFFTRSQPDAGQPNDGTIA
jgi:signal peptidase II